MGFNSLIAYWLIGVAYAERAIMVGMIAWAIVVVVTFIYIRKARDFSPFNKIGKVVHAVARHAANVVKAVRNSRFYDPLRGLVKRDPTILMIILFTVLVVFLSNQLLRYITDAVVFLALAVRMILGMSIVQGVWMLVGALVNAYLIFLLSMMLFMFISFLFDFLHKISKFASRFINPWLQVVERAGIPRTWSFFFFYIIVSIFQQAFASFFRGA